MSLQKLVEFEEKKHVLRVLYKDGTTQDISFNRTEDLQQNLNIDCTQMQRVIVFGYRTTPFNPCESSQVSEEERTYEEFPHFEKQLKNLQKGYKYRKEKHASPSTITANTNPTERQTTSPLETTAKKPFVYQIPRYDGETIYFKKDLEHKFGTVNGFCVGSKDNVQYYSTRLQLAGAIFKEHIVPHEKKGYEIQLHPWSSVVAAAEKANANLITSGKGGRELKFKYFLFTCDISKAKSTLVQHITPYLLEQVKGLDVDVETGKVKK